MTNRKLYRSRKSRMLGGVCGGLAEYLGVDVTVIRVIFVITLFFGGAGALAYLILWLIIPEAPSAPNNPPPSDAAGGPSGGV